MLGAAMLHFRGMYSIKLMSFTHSSPFPTFSTARIFGSFCHHASQSSHLLPPQLFLRVYPPWRFRLAKGPCLNSSKEVPLEVVPCNGGFMQHMIAGHPSSSSFLYIWNQGIDRYLISWYLWACFQIYRELEDEGHDAKRTVKIKLSIPLGKSVSHLNGISHRPLPTKQRFTTLQRVSCFIEFDLLQLLVGNISVVVSSSFTASGWRSTSHVWNRENGPLFTSDVFLLDEWNSMNMLSIHPGLDWNQTMYS